MTDTDTIFTLAAAPALRGWLEAHPHAGIYVLTDENTRRVCYPSLAEALGEHTLLTPMAAGDTHKTLATAQRLWQELSDRGATRSSLIVSIGGGVVTDMGGFVASTYRRGAPSLYIPTTLLGAVDAATGGKTGVNLGALKNQVGTFSPAAAVIVSPEHYATLPTSELLSGYAEMIKHALLQGPDETAALLADAPQQLELAQMLQAVESSLAVKQRIVAADPTEHGLRKALNLGHTAGHAIESMWMERARPVPHGYAVAWGLVVAMVLSHTQLGLSTQWLMALAIYVREHYGPIPVGCNDYAQLIELMRHDKKNDRASSISFTLLTAPGEPVIDCHPDLEAVQTALDIARDLCC